MGEDGVPPYPLRDIRKQNEDFGSPLAVSSD